MVGDRRLWACALGAVAVLALSACTGGEAVPEPSSSATTAATAPTAPTPSPSESAVPKPERPADMDRTDEAGAAAAAQYFLSLYGYVMSTGDVTEWDAMSWETCHFCSGTRDRASTMASAKDSFTGGEITPIGVQVYALDDLLDAYPVDVHFSQAAYAHRDSTGRSIDLGEEQEGTFGVDAKNISGQWKVLAVTDQSK